MLKKVLDSSKDTINNESIKAVMKEVIPTYHNPEEVNCKAEESEEMNEANTVNT